MSKEAETGTRRGGDLVDGAVRDAADAAERAGQALPCADCSVQIAAAAGADLADPADIAEVTGHTETMLRDEWDQTVADARAQGLTETNVAVWTRNWAERTVVEYRRSVLALLRRTAAAEAEARKAYGTALRNQPLDALEDEAKSAAAQVARQARQRTAEHLLTTQLAQLRAATRATPEPADDGPICAGCGKDVGGSLQAGCVWAVNRCVSTVRYAAGGGLPHDHCGCGAASACAEKTARSVFSALDRCGSPSLSQRRHQFHAGEVVADRLTSARAESTGQGVVPHPRTAADLRLRGEDPSRPATLEGLCVFLIQGAVVVHAPQRIACLCQRGQAAGHNGGQPESDRLRPRPWLRWCRCHRRGPGRFQAVGRSRG